MGISIYGPDGSLDDVDGGPFQYTAEGFRTDLAVNSKPLTQWIGGAGTWRRMYRHQVWVKVCVDKLTFAISRLPLKVYERNSQNEKTRVTSGELVDMIRTPDRGKSAIDLKQWIIKPLLVHGDAGVRIRRDRAGGRPVGFRKLYRHVLDPRIVNANALLSDPDYWIYRGEPTQPEVLQPEDVLHVNWDSLDGPIGVSPLRSLMVTMRIEHAAQRYQEFNFRNSVRPPGGVTLPDNDLAKNREFREIFEAELMRLYGGPENSGKPILLPPGGKWESFAYSASDAELIAQRKLTREEVAAAYDLAPPLIGILDHATYSNIAELQRALFQTTVPPWLTLAEDSFNAQVVFPEPAFEGQWVEFDLTDVLRGDPVKEAAALKAGMNGGGMTLNEVRAVRNQPKIDHPHADEPLVPSNNLVPISQIGNDNGNSDQNAPNDDQPASKAIASNLERTAERIYRRMKAGDAEAWSPDRFERELADDLKSAGMNGHATGTAKAFAGAVGVLVADADGDPDIVRANLAALKTSVSEGSPK